MSDEDKNSALGSRVIPPTKMNLPFYHLTIKPIALLLLFFLCLNVNMSAFALPPFWTQEMPFSLGEAESTQPDVCARKEEVFVVWADNRIDGNYELFFRYSSDGGLTWSIEERITETEADSIQPAIACDRSGVYLVWCEKEKTSHPPQSPLQGGKSPLLVGGAGGGQGGLSSEIATIFYSRRDGKSWSVPNPLSSTPQNNPRRPDIAITQTGVVYIVWEEDSEDEVEVGDSNPTLRAYFTFSNGNMVFQNPEPITIGDWNTSEPKVAGGYRTAYVVWRDEREATAQIYTKQLGETLFGYDTRLSNVIASGTKQSAGNCSRPSIDVSEPQIYVAYESRSTEFFPANIFVVESNNSGQSWTQAHQLTYSTAESIRPAISAASNMVWVFWQDGESGNWKTHFSYKNVSSQTFPPPPSVPPTRGEGDRGGVSDPIWAPSERFRDSSTTESLHAIAHSSPAKIGSLRSEPQFYLFWVEVSSSPTNILYSRRDTIPPETPGKPLHIDEDAKVGYDNDDTLTFSWTQEKKVDEEVAGYNIYASIDSKDGDFEKIGSTDRTIYNLTAIAPDFSREGRYYQVRVEAFDSVGNTSELSPASEVVYVDNIPPYVQIHLPRSGSMLVCPVPIIVSCFDENLVSCRLKYGATNAPTVWQDLGEPIRTEIDHERILVWDISDLQGVYTLNLVALDEAGNQSFSKIPVIVDRLPPLPISPGERTKLPDLDLESAYRTPSFSFDGNSICFSSNEGGTENIWVYSISSRSRVRITQDQHIDLFPTWSPDSNWIAFQSLVVEQAGSMSYSTEQAGSMSYSTEQAGSMSYSAEQAGSMFYSAPGWDIWIVRSDGTDRRPLIQSEWNETTPVFSPSGKQMAFISDRDGDEEIYILTNVMEVMAGTEPLIFQLTYNDYSDTNPAWAPDETRLAFCANRFGNWDVFEIDIDGSREKRLTDQFADETHPKYSPDGKRILYLSNSSGTYNSVMARNLECNDSVADEPVKLTMPGEDVSYADWAPDMQSIVYQVRDSIQFRKIDFPVKDLKAVITRPYEGENLSRQFIINQRFIFLATSGADRSVCQFDIKGIAKGANFEKYILEYFHVGDGSYQDADLWRPIGGYSTAQVEYEDFLGRLNTSNLQGEYIIRLTVMARDDSAIAEVRVFVQSEHPNLSIKKPLDGVISSAEMISVEGDADRFATVTVNGTKIELDENGHFLTKVFLNEGVNKIVINAVNPTGLESHVEREVIRDTKKPEIDLTSPADFVLRKTPYVTVSGQVSEFADITMLKYGNSYNTDVQSPRYYSYALRIPLDDDRRFSHTISLNEGTNEVRLKAKDLAGFESEILRRVIYKKPHKSPRDTNPPAITNVFPLNGITLDTNKIQVKALLVDDLKIDINTLIFSFDGEQYIFDPKEEEYTEFDGEIFDFNPETGEFSYIPEFSLADGEHNFTFDVMDEEENSADSVSITFFIDTRPISVALSASKDDNRLVVSLASNKRLDRILEANVYPTLKDRLISTIGYSLNLDLSQEGSDDKPFLYTGTFYPAPTHEGFILSALCFHSFGFAQDRRNSALGSGVIPPMKTKSILPTSEIYNESVMTQSLHSMSESSKAKEVREQLRLSPLAIWSIQSAISKLQEAIEAIGFYTEGEFTGEKLFLSIPNGPSVSIEDLGYFNSQSSIVLRSQDGSDLDRVAAQLKDAENRNLKTKPILEENEGIESWSPVVYQLESSEELEVPIQLELRLPNLDEAPHKAMFYWDEGLDNWQPLDAMIDAQTGYFITTLKHDSSIEKSEPQKGLLSNAFGSYALLIDDQPPVIEKIFPEDGKDVPLDRFFVEINFYDEGSGIARADLEVDGEPVDFILDRRVDRLTYLPRDLESGLHRLSVSVYDRASNSAHRSSTFFTQKIFAFADEPICYPNPVSQMVTISFRLTQSADVITLEIYNVAGEQVYKTQSSGRTAVSSSNSQRSEFVWNCENQSGKPIASGVYIYLLKAKRGDKEIYHKGKIAVLK